MSTVDRLTQWVFARLIPIMWEPRKGDLLADDCECGDDDDTCASPVPEPSDLLNAPKCGPCGCLGCETGHKTPGIDARGIIRAAE